MIIANNRKAAAQNWNGIFNELFNELNASQNPAKTTTKTGFQPPVNIIETEDAYHLEVLAPGKNKDLFKLAVEQDQLIISYQMAPSTSHEEKSTNETSSKANYLRKEFSIYDFKRTFSLDEKVHTDGIEAKYEQGILQVILPKKAVIVPPVKEITIR